MELTIRKAIELCIDKGIKGAESQLKSFDKNGRLASKDQINALQTNLECIYESVEIKGSGKRGRVTLNNPLTTIKQKVDGRASNGYKHTEDELILDEYVFNFLLKRKQHKAMTYKTWANRIDFFPMQLLKSKNMQKEMEDEINNLHRRTMKFSNNDCKAIVSLFITTIEDRGSDIVEKAFSRLEKAGRIIIENKYFTKTVYDKFEEITVEAYELFIKEENIILEEVGLSRNEYIRMRILPSHQDKKYKEAAKRIKKQLKEKYGIRFYYIAKLPIVLDRENQKPSEVDGMAAYYRRLFALTESRQASYDNRYEKWQVWYLVNTFTLLKMFDVPIPEEVYNQELQRLKADEFGFDEREYKLTKEIDDGLDNLPCNF